MSFSNCFYKKINVHLLNSLKHLTMLAILDKMWIKVDFTVVGIDCISLVLDTEGESDGGFHGYATTLVRNSSVVTRSEAPWGKKEGGGGVDETERENGVAGRKKSEKKEEKWGKLKRENAKSCIQFSHYEMLKKTVTEHREGMESQESWEMIPLKRLTHTQSCSN